MNVPAAASLFVIAVLGALSPVLRAAEPAAQAPAPVRTPSGIEITMLTEGKGASPRASDTVRVHYRGTLTNGREFDSSYKRGQPATFPLNRVIPCWTEGVQALKVGGKAKLLCPANLAYGSRGVPGTIPPDAPLVFEVELIEVMR
jgi:FKBP-type peptidyl-prolyl cis-trans isomerase FkpA